MNIKIISLNLCDDRRESQCRDNAERFEEYVISKGLKMIK